MEGNENVTSLDSVFNPQTEEQAAPETQVEAPQAQPEETGVETQAAPPAAEQSNTESELPPAAYKAVADERRKRQELERQNVEYQRQFAEVQRYLQQQQAQQFAKSAQQPKTEQGIDPANFPSYEAYLEAVAETKAEAKANEIFERNMRRAMQVQQQAAVQQQTSVDLVDMLKAGKERYADFEHVVGNQSVQITDVMMNTMMALDGGHEVAYSLGMNPAEAARIARMPPSSQAREIGKLAKAFVVPPPPVVVAPPVVPQLPKTLTQTRSASGQFTNKPWTGPTPLDEVVRRK